MLTSCETFRRGNLFVWFLSFYNENGKSLWPGSFKKNNFNNLLFTFTLILLIDALSTSKTFKLHKETWFITTILACALMSVVIVITLFLWRKLMNKKNPETNNNKASFTKRNLEVVAINLTGGGGGVTTRLSNSTRISSIRTEKEYFQLPVDKEWEVDFEDIEIRDRIGEGEFGRVMIAHVYNLPKHPDIHQVAVKMLKGMFAVFALTLPVPFTSESCTDIKIKLNFYFHV